MSVDGADFKVWEMKHPTMPIDKGGYSHKFNHGGIKYEITIDIYTSKGDVDLGTTQSVST